MNYFIFAIAIVIYLLQYNIEKIKKTYKDYLKYIWCCTLLLVLILGPNTLLNNIYSEKYKLNTDKSFSTIPYLYMGMSEGERANGWYNDEVGKIVFDLMNAKEDTTQIKEECNQKFKERIEFLSQHPIYTTKFYIKKLITIWADPTMEFKFYNTYQIEEKDVNNYPIAKEILLGETYDKIVIYQKGINLIIFMGTILAIVLNRKKLDKDIMLLCLIFLGGFSFHLLWEAKSRYIIPYIVILIPIACIGITEVIHKLESKIRNILNRKEIEKC